MKKLIVILLSFIFLLLTKNVLAEKEGDKFTSLIENGAQLIRQNNFEKVLDMISEIPQEQKSDFRIKVLESFSYLQGYMVTKKKTYGDKWKYLYRVMIHSADKTATLILLELLKDGDIYVRSYAAVTLGYAGDQRALEELRKVSSQDKSGKVRAKAKWAYEQISGSKVPKERETVRDKEVIEEKPKPSTADETTTGVLIISLSSARKYFHKKDCRDTWGYPTQEMSIQEATQAGFMPCPKCSR